MAARHLRQPVTAASLEPPPLPDRPASGGGLCVGNNLRGVRSFTPVALPHNVRYPIKDWNGFPPMDDVPSPADRPGRLAVGVVGAGRVGTVLGAALRRAGHDVLAASGVSDASRRRAESLLPGVPLRPVDEVVAHASLVLLTAPDDALPALVEGLAATDATRAGQLVAHASGRHGIALLEPLVRRGALPLALHPVLTFSGTEVDLQRLPGTSFGVTAPAPLRPVAEALVLEMGGEPVWIEEELRPLYHAALAAGANHLVTLVASSADLLRKAGVDAPGRMLGPLLGAALDNALRAG